MRHESKLERIEGSTETRPLNRPTAVINESTGSRLLRYNNRLYEWPLQPAGCDKMKSREVDRGSIGHIFAWHAVYLSLVTSFSRILERLRSPLSLSLSLSLSFSLSLVGRIDIRARMRLRASSTSFTWLPQKKRDDRINISHTDFSWSSTSNATRRCPPRLVVHRRSRKNVFWKSRDPPNT